MNLSLFSNVREINTDEKNYSNNFKVVENFKFLEDFSKDLVNTKTFCKSCKRPVRESLITGVVGCSKCYNSILNLISKDTKKVTLYNSKGFKKFLNLDKIKYEGKIPQKVKEYFVLKNKIYELENELKISIENEDYVKCNILKETIDDFNKKLLKFRRKVNG